MAVHVNMAIYSRTMGIYEHLDFKTIKPTDEDEQ